MQKRKFAFKFEGLQISGIKNKRIFKIRLILKFDANFDKRK
ncbi:hypothetical protein CSUNSWCD_351 [Campylobacter showae CSUNSWCD]|uniref:Uncharacterized protein n=1 Tax=Campylobacter showae CSUNSWCD TaxID=1244083 RepID=M5ISE0_9BACT|nr:hypothetical protein CSUNSWCD_351 [Campylobacter showae CSUNSWCD]